MAGGVTGNPTGNAQLTNYDNTMRIYGMGSQMDTQSLVDMEMQMVELKSYPLLSKIQNYTNERSTWVDLRMTLNVFLSSVDELKGVSAAEKKAVVSDPSSIGVALGTEAQPGQYSLAVHQLAKAHKVLSDAKGDPAAALGLGGTVQINGRDLIVTESMSMNQLAATINAGEYGIHAAVINGTLIATSKETGTDQVIRLADSETGVLKSLGLLDSADGIKHEVQAAQDAKLSVDGIEMTSGRNTVEGKVPGMTFTLLKESTVPIALEVKNHHESLQNKIIDFVKSYNETLGKIAKLTGKGGVLQGNAIPNQVRRDMASALAQKQGTELYLHELGIEIDGIKKDGTLSLNTTKLAEKLAENPEKALKLFGGETGIATLLSQKINSLTNETGTLGEKLKTIDSAVTRLNKELDKMDVYLEQQRQSIIKKYARYETMMSQLQLQNQFISAQLESLNGTKK